MLDGNENDMNHEWNIPDDGGEDDSTPALRLYYRGRTALKEGNLHQALSFLLMSKDLQAHYKTLEMIYIVLKSLQLVDEGYIYIEKAYALNSNSDRTGVLYAEALIKEGKLKQAKETLLHVLKRNQTYLPAEKLLDSIPIS